jgi:hypothetical protein
LTLYKCRFIPHLFLSLALVFLCKIVLDSLGALFYLFFGAVAALIDDMNGKKISIFGS